MDLVSTPEKPTEALAKIDAQYKRNQDSRDLPSAAILQKNCFQPRLNCLTIK
jgi:hypothetical protein